MNGESRRSLRDYISKNAIGIAALVLSICIQSISDAGNPNSFLQRVSESPNESVVFNTNRDAQKADQDLTYTYYRDNYLPRWYSPVSNLPSNWVRWTKNTFAPANWPVLAGLGALTTILVATDYETWRFTSCHYHKSPMVKKAADILEFMGDGKFQFGIAGLYAVVGLVSNDTRALRTALQITEAILSTGGVVQLLKHVTGRESPFVTTEPTGQWQWFPNQIAYHQHVPHYDAMPSGHIATATTTLIVIAENYPEYKWIRPAGYVLLGAISTALVTTSIHWWSDIPLGIAIGYSFGMIASHPRGIELNGIGKGGRSANLNILPIFSADTKGLSLSYSF
jgi:membrane-associated phospholipid phosphatase